MRHYLRVSFNSRLMIQDKVSSLFRRVNQTYLKLVLDNKLQLCAYFKAGVCEKGKKCKYSHDLSLEDKKTANIDIYSDPRQKIGKVPDTIITCKTFIDAVENNQYGFNWVCPNGGDDC